MQPRGATPRPKSGEVAGGSYPSSEVRGGGRECQAVTEQEQPRGATPARGQGQRPGGAVAAQVPEGLEELFHVQGWEEQQ